MEPAIVLVAVVIAILRVLSGRRDRQARSTVARALNGLPSGREARFPREPRGRWIR